MMAKDTSGVKNALKSAQAGTPVPAKDFSPKKKEAKAAGNGKPEKGSMKLAAILPVETAKSTPVPTESKWEGSAEDWSQDYSAAKRRGKSTADYEDSAHDRIADAAGERRMKADESKSQEYDVHSSYKRGTPAMSNSPKAAHGFGHTGSQCQGHLRCSGSAGAHQIGKKK
jgi:hypothetical protein